MTDLNWIYSYGFLGIRLFDLPSFLMCLLLIVIAGYKFKIPSNYQVILALHCLLPFVLNDVLFSTSYMGDQFRYWRGVNAIRSGELGIMEALTSGENVLQARRPSRILCNCRLD